MPCSVHRTVSCAASLYLVGQTTPGGAAHVHYREYLGLDPPHQLTKGLEE
jgi:hypothetical protein